MISAAILLFSVRSPAANPRGSAAGASGVTVTRAGCADVTRESTSGFDTGNTLTRVTQTALRAEPNQALLV
ncbi:hypothetical protein GCM10009838_73720 [Catenulispora subtropica]|uniref:Uncharacterized protein n=1 Tax=Catenulispora subtropica TaxID=450798 RepID=A0ABP5EFS3_9ACTN